MKVGTWQQPTPKGALLGLDRCIYSSTANIRVENVEFLLNQSIIMTVFTNT